MSGLSPTLIAELSKMVERKVAKVVEIKRTYGVFNSTCGSYNYTSFGTNQILAITPYSARMVIPQGTGQADRIGNSIVCKRARLRALFTVAPYNVTTNPTPTPFYIQWYIFRKKENATELSSLSSFYAAGNTSIAPSGSNQDLLYDVNTDSYVVFKSGQIKMGYSAFVATPGGVAGSGYQSNNDSEMSAILDVDYTSASKKKVVFNDTTSNSLSDLEMFTFWTVNQDGSATANSTYQANAYIQLQYDYTDA